MGGTATPSLNIEDHRRSSRSCWGCSRGSPSLGQRKSSLHKGLVVRPAVDIGTKEPQAGLCLLTVQ